jgi:hypothetical protein
MGASVVKWVSDDGQSFDTREDMIIHELTLVDAKEIDIFLAINQTAPRKVPEYKKLLVLWQTHMRKQTMPELGNPQQLELDLVMPLMSGDVASLDKELNAMLKEADEDLGYWPDALEEVGLKAVVQ